MYIKKKHAPPLAPLSGTEEIQGTVQGHRDGHGFVLRDDGVPQDIYLAPNEMRAVLHKDRVRVRIVRQDRRGRPEGRVLEIVQRQAQTIIGRLLLESGVWLVAPEDKRYGQDILIPKDALGQAQTGQVVVVTLTEPPALYGQPVGRITEVLGEVDDPGMEVEIAVRKYGMPHVFSEDCLKQAQSLPDSVTARDKHQRVDLTDIGFVTIDGEDARDFDDAVYCESARAGRGKGWRLLVAIADVSHYVHTGSAIDVDAYDRATSVYFPRRVIPMLPEKLSNGLCSLNPEVDRLSLVCDMVINGKGDIHAYQFYPAVIRSQARMTYTEVAAILTNTRGPEAEKHQARLPNLLALHDAFRALLTARQARGAVDFDTVETAIVCDELGRIEKILPRVRNDAHRLIEEAMLAANVCSADFLGHSGHLGLYRVHEGPTPEKQDMLRSYLKALGVPFSLSDDPQPAEFQAIALATQERPDAAQIQTMLLRSMQQALYTPSNSGHFGLAYQAYTHFTSPIRRYPDLLNHRVIKAILAKKTYTLPALPTPGEAQQKLAQRLASKQASTTSNMPQRGARSTASTTSQHPAAQRQSPEFQAWEAAGLHCSANERRADEASRDVQAWLKCQYMRNHLGEEFNGTVSTVTSFGLFVTLDAMYIEGLVHITELGSEYFRFDEARQELRGEHTGLRYAIGTPVRVQVSRVDLDGRKIDFQLVADSTESHAIRSGKSSRDRAAKKTAARKTTSDESALPSPGADKRLDRSAPTGKVGKNGKKMLAASAKESKPKKPGKAAKVGKTTAQRK